MYIKGMKSTRGLSAEQKEFFTAVSRAAFCNPFSEARLELDLRIADAPPGVDRTELTDRVIARNAESIGALERDGIYKLSDLPSDDARAMRTAYLFEIFHRYLDDFDEHIRRQISNPEKPLTLRFASDIMSAFHNRGFSEMEAVRYLAFFFQMRRAFYFLTRDLVGDSPSMKEFRCRLWNNLFTHDTAWFGDFLWDRMEDFSTLILGETGTGKGAAAAALGRSGHIPFDANLGRFTESFTKIFIETNLSQYPESLIESELFGHKKGSFTGAINDHKGVFAQCAPHGAIFLDEIGDVTIPVQIKLLHVLQNRTFSPVGSHETQRFSGRVIAATNRPLDRLRREGAFRDDFYYRLSSDVIAAPSLKQRLQEDPSEIRVLLERLIERIAGTRDPDLVETVAEILDRNPGRDYPWPGNVRELEQAVRRIFLSGEYRGEVTAAAPDKDETIKVRIGEGEMSAQELLCDYCLGLYRKHGTYEMVSKITGLDRRTVKKYVLSSKS